MSKLIIGLTGGIGSGKTTITNYFQTHGVAIVDADNIAREVVAIDSPALKAIFQHFGKEYFHLDGRLNRALLRSRIFSNEDDRHWLNALLHPLIRSELIAQTQSADSPYCILVAPLLIENNLLPLVDRVLVVDVSEDIQLTRTQQRDTSSPNEIKAIISSQATRASRIEAADDIINNDTATLVEIEAKVSALDKKYLSLTKIL